ncbi:hint module-domain-containing protein [Hyaloraphidium curvatum]|nr:hint module-domain-containing protein [Hyaloraphidium curvatum]
MHGNAIEQEERLMCEQVDAAADLLLATYAAASRRHLAALVDGIRNAVPPAADYVPSAANPTADPARFRQWIDERLRSFDGTARGPNDAVTAARERLASDLGSFLRLYQQQAEDFRRAERRAREQEERTRQEQERMRAERERMEGDLRAQAELRQRQMEEQARQAAEELGREREAAAAQLREVNARHMQDLRDTQAEMRSQAQQQLEETVAPLNRRIQELSADVARETARANDLQRQADELRNRGGCFASSCTAELEDGRRIGVAELRVGDHVRVARGGFEPVVGFYDADTDAEPCFLEVAFGLQDGQSGMITLTHNHMVIASNGSGPALPMQAHKLIPGTSFLMLAGSMDPVPVVSVRASDVRGAYSPATPGGTIAVSDRGPAVVASCYAKPSTFSKLAWDDAAVDAALHGASWLLRMWWAASGLAGWPLAGGAAGTGKAGPGVRALKAAAAAAFSWIGLLD